VTLYNPVSEKSYKSEFSTRYLACYDLLKKENLEVSFDETENTITQNFAAKSMIKLSSDFPNESLPKFHTKRIMKGFITTLVVMEDK
jgi:hypothetical protein